FPFMTRSHFGMGLPVMEYLSMPSGPETDTSWTDDLPLCSQTGVGFSQNQSYKRDGHWNPDHESEDESFHVQDGGICLYGVFDGHCGTKASKFAKEKMPAEILLGQLLDNSSEETVREVLRQAFLSVEKEYFSDFIGQQLAERTTLIAEMPMPQGRSLYECSPVLARLNQEVASGTTAVVVLIFHGKLYVSNVGNSRALLCRTDPEGVLRVGQLSVDHDLRNDDELCRLQQLGLDVQKLVAASRLGNQINTRCLGNYLVKGGYKEFDQLQNAGGEPVIATPEIHPGVTLDDSCRFLILFTDGLYKALSEATESEQVNIHLAQMIVEEFKTQSSLNLVAQAVVDKVSRMHHDYYMKSTYPNKANKREDMTLLIRNFNFPLPNSTMSPPGSRNVGHYTQHGIYRPVNYGYDSNNATPVNASVGDGPSSAHLMSTNRSITTNSTSNTEPTTSTDSDLLTHSEHRLTLDENGRVLPYVDFSDYYKNLGYKSGWSDDDIF
ncbi:TGF-beta-activated kinase 1 and MAP3K7-binding protein 1, partial [Orchesella cincta]